MQQERTDLRGRYVLAIGVLLGATALTAKLAALALTEPDPRGAPEAPTTEPTPTAEAADRSPVSEKSSGLELPFHRRYEYDHIVVHTNVEFETDRVERIAKRTCSEVAALTGLPIPSKKLRVYLCDDSEQVLALQKHYDIRIDATGTYFHNVPVAVVREHSVSERTISHEMVHWIIRHGVRRCPSLINEGIAVLVAERVLVRTIVDDFLSGSPKSRTPKVTLASMRNRAARLRRYLDGGKRFGLGELLPLTPSRFEKLNEDSLLFYALSWCLAKTLEDHGKELGVTIRSFFKRLRAGEDSRTILLSFAIETAWMETVAAVGKPATR